MTVAMTQGVLNALSPKTRRAWDADRRRRAPRTGGPQQTRAQFTAGLAKLAAMFPGAVKVKGQPVEGD